MGLEPTTLSLTARMLCPIDPILRKSERAYPDRAPSPADLAGVSALRSIPRSMTVLAQEHAFGRLSGEVGPSSATRPLTSAKRFVVRSRGGNWKLWGSGRSRTLPARPGRRFDRELKCAAPRRRLSVLDSGSSAAEKPPLRRMWRVMPGRGHGILRAARPAARAVSRCALRKHHGGLEAMSPQTVSWSTGRAAAPRPFAGPKLAADDFSEQVFARSRHAGAARRV